MSVCREVEPWLIHYEKEVALACQRALKKGK